MHPDSEARLKKVENAVLRQAARMFNLNGEPPRRLGSFESFVYEVHNGREPCILRVTDSDHRPAEQILSELDWLDHLAHNGAPVCQPHRSIDGNLVEVFHAENDEPAADYFSLVVFERASGGPAGDTDWGPALFRTWGETIGTLHRLTQDYRPSHGIATRRHWHEDPDFRLHHSLGAGYDRLKERCDATIANLKRLPTDPSVYNLCHNDVHPGNFFVHNGRMTVFDFDDAHYDWLMNDLASALFYALRRPSVGEDNVEFARVFWANLLEGYARQHVLDRRWLEHVPVFLKLREFLLYVLLQIEAPDSTHPWCVSYMKGRRQRIEGDIPVIAMSFD